jgi:hypothetical protein
MYESPRQVVYSYLPIDALIKVASLSKRERETVLNSKIVKENRKKNVNFWSHYDTVFFERYNSDVAV